MGTQKRLSRSSANVPEASVDNLSINASFASLSPSCHRSFHRATGEDIKRLFPQDPDLRLPERWAMAVGDMPLPTAQAALNLDLWKESFNVLARSPMERSVAPYDGLEHTETALMDKLSTLASGTLAEDLESRFWLPVSLSLFTLAFGCHPKRMGSRPRRSSRNARPRFTGTKGNRTDRRRKGPAATGPDGRACSSKHVGRRTAITSIHEVFYADADRIR